MQGKKKKSATLGLEERGNTAGRKRGRRSFRDGEKMISHALIAGGECRPGFDRGRGATLRRKGGGGDASEEKERGRACNMVGNRGVQGKKKRGGRCRRLAEGHGIIVQREGGKKKTGARRKANERRTVASTRKIPRKRKGSCSIVWREEWRRRDDSYESLLLKRNEGGDAFNNTRIRKQFKSASVKREREG